MFRDWIAKFLLTDKKTNNLKEAICFDINLNISYKKLAINTAINLIADGLTKAVFRTFEKGEEVRKNNHYLFNVQPNQNQNAAEFMRSIVSNLVYDNEALVIMKDKQLYVANDWHCKKYALKENIYKNVTIGDFIFDKNHFENEVLHFTLNNVKIISLIDGLYADYGKLIAASTGYYKRSNAYRAALYLDKNGPQTDEEQEAEDDLFNVQFKNFFEAEGGAVLPLQDGLELKELFNQSGQSGTKDTRDIRALVDDIFDFVSISLQIPSGLLKGDLAEVENQVDNFIMFALNPIAEIIKDEVNRKYYSKSDYLERTYLNVDTTMIKHVDPVKMAQALEKYISTGTHSINENRRMVDKEPLKEKWADKHYITKNYSEAEEYLKGGEDE